MTNSPQFPLYIPSKTRYDSNFTAKYLDYMKVPYKLVVEEQEYYLYLSALGDRKKLLVLDNSYKEKYDYCDDYATDKPTGSGPARNFIWEHSISEGHKYHWIMDDNIRSFRRLNKNEKVSLKDNLEKLLPNKRNKNNKKKKRGTKKNKKKKQNITLKIEEKKKRKNRTKKKRKKKSKENRLKDFFNFLN